MKKFSTRVSVEVKVLLGETDITRRSREAASSAYVESFMKDHSDTAVTLTREGREEILLETVRSDNNNITTHTLPYL